MINGNVYNAALIIRVCLWQCVYIVYACVCGMFTFPTRTHCEVIRSGEGGRARVVNPLSRIIRAHRVDNPLRPRARTPPVGVTLYNIIYDVATTVTII